MKDYLLNAIFKTANNNERNTVSIAILFWIIMIIGFLFSGYTNRTNFGNWAMGNLVTWVLFALLGWAVFGPALHR